MFLLRGGRKVIPAHLAPHKLRNLMLTLAREINQAALEKDWQEFRYADSRDEIDPGTNGIAAPIFDGHDKVTGSLAITVRESKPHEMSFEELGQRLIQLTRRITAAITASRRGDQQEPQAS
jgi:DNA-binding IclR family transcriptional regulator